MARGLVFASIAAVILTVFAVVDCALTERRRVRALPKWAWILITLLVPVVGPVLWLFLGRGPSRERPAPRYIGPDDDPSFLSSRTSSSPPPAPDEARWQELEQELANLESDPDADDEGEPGRR